MTSREPVTRRGWDVVREMSEQSEMSAAFKRTECEHWRSTLPRPPSADRLILELEAKAVLDGLHREQYTTEQALDILGALVGWHCPPDLDEIDLDNTPC